MPKPSRQLHVTVGFRSFPDAGIPFGMMPVAVVLMDHFQHIRGVNQRCAAVPGVIDQPVVPHRPPDGERWNVRPQSPPVDEIIDSRGIFQAAPQPHLIANFAFPGAVGKIDLLLHVQVPPSSDHEKTSAHAGRGPDGREKI